jgi:hypothetical protein
MTKIVTAARIRFRSISGIDKTVTSTYTNSQ